jgi:hypothetical protein
MNRSAQIRREIQKRSKMYAGIAYECRDRLRRNCDPASAYQPSVRPYSGVKESSIRGPMDAAITTSGSNRSDPFSPKPAGHHVPGIDVVHGLFTQFSLHWQPPEVAREARRTQRGPIGKSFTTQRDHQISDSIALLLATRAGLAAQPLERG